MFARYTVAFEDGPTVEVSVTSRDTLRLEREGVQVHKLPAAEGTYRLVYAALQRYTERGKIDADLPATVDEFMDCADIDAHDDSDPKDQGQSTS